MEISEIWVYPIKSLRGVSLPTATLTEHGIPYDRHFMLLKDHHDASKAPKGSRYENMAVSHFPYMCLFTTALNVGRGEVQVTFMDPESKTRKTQVIPLTPDHENLEQVEVNMHESKTMGLIMPEEYSNWFSECFGFDVIFVYLGENYRQVLGNIAPNAATRNASRRAQSNRKSWISTVISSVPGLSSLTAEQDDEDYQITFADVSPYLITSRTSLKQLSSRLPDGVEMDITKFRPNIVVDGAETPFEEDYWGAISIHRDASSRDENANPDEQGVTLQLTANCIRCTSINVDYSTGAPGKGPAGQMLKKMQADRRVDAGHKHSPVYGRYGFLDRNASGTEGRLEISVGDRVRVAERNAERTILKWPGFGSIAKDDLYPV